MIPPHGPWAFFSCVLLCKIQKDPVTLVALRQRLPARFSNSRLAVFRTGKGTGPRSCVGRAIEAGDMQSCSHGVDLPGFKLLVPRNQTQQVIKMQPMIMNDVSQHQPTPIQAAHSATHLTFNQSPWPPSQPVHTLAITDGSADSQSSQDSQVTQGNPHEEQRRPTYNGGHSQGEAHAPQGSGEKPAPVSTDENINHMMSVLGESIHKADFWTQHFPAIPSGL